MKKQTIIFSLFTALIFTSCDKREDFFAESNQAPLMEISCINTISSTIKDFTPEPNLSDSFNLKFKDYLIDFKIIDDSKDVKFEYFVDNNAQTETVSFSKTEDKTKNYIVGQIKITPTNIGIHTINLIATDPYGKSKRTTLTLRVYLSNIHPVLQISTGSNMNNSNPTLVSSNIVDTFLYSQGNIIIDYLIQDDNLNYVFNIATNNGATINEDLSSKIINQQTGYVIVNGKLILTPTATGNHTIDITVTDETGLITTLSANIYIKNVTAQIFVKTESNVFSTNIGYTPTFYEYFLFEKGVPTYIIKYKIIDDSPNPAQTLVYTASNSATITENINLRTSSTIGGITTLEGELTVTPVLSGAISIKLTVTEITGLITSSNTLDARYNQPPIVNLAPILWNNSGKTEIYHLYTASNPNDPSVFGDYIILYEVRVLYGGGSIYFQTSTTTPPTSSSGFILPANNFPGSTTWFIEVRAHDSWGKISPWSQSNLIYN